MLDRLSRSLIKLDENIIDHIQNDQWDSSLVDNRQRLLQNIIKLMGENIDEVTVGRIHASQKNLELALQVAMKDCSDDIEENYSLGRRLKKYNLKDVK
jgi:leucyl-tRNA synthetase